MNDDELLVRAAIRDELSQPLQGIREDVQGLKKDVAALDRAGTTGARGVDKVGKSAKRAAREIKLADTHLAGFARRLTRRTLTGALVGGSLLGGAGIKTAAELEQANIGFETMLGSAKRADRFLDRIKKTAMQTPFELSGLVQYSQKLLAFGFQAKDVIPTLRTLGDAASGLGLGEDGLNRLVIALGQIKAKGRVQGDEILQLTEAGIPAQRILRNALNLTAAEYDKMQRKGQISSEVAIPALLAGLRRGSKGIAGETTKFGGLMEKQSTSLKGLWSNLMDTIRIKSADALEPLIPMIKEGLAGAIDRVGPLMDQAADASERFFADLKAGRGTAGAIRSTVETLIATGRGLLDLFNDLPGPVKKYGLMVLFGVVALRKMNAVLGFGEKGLGTWAKGLLNAETRAARLKTGISQLAGAGGMVLLADSAGRAGTQMGVLESAAGGALAGGALGAFAGPPGIAIGAAIGGIAGAGWNLVKATKEGGKSARFAIDDWTAYADTLTGVKGAITGTTRTMAFDRAKKSGMLDWAEQLKIDPRVMVNAVLGRKKAVRIVRDALEREDTTLGTGLSIEQRTQIAQELGALDQSRIEYLQRMAAITEDVKKARQYQRALRREIAKQSVDWGATFFEGGTRQGKGPLKKTGNSIVDRLMNGGTPAPVGKAFNLGKGKVTVEAPTDAAKARVDALVNYINGRTAKITVTTDSLFPPVGDTYSSRARGPGSLTNTLAKHADYSGRLSGRYRVTNALIGGGGRGQGSGDHQRGRAVDVVGPNLPAYARQVRADGGYAAIHGTGSGRHVHAVPAGDTATSRGTNGSRPSIVVSPGAVQIAVHTDRELDVERAVTAGLRNAIRDAEEAAD